MTDDSEDKIEGIGCVKIHLHDGSVKTSGTMTRAKQLSINLISLRKLDSFGYGY